ncbi:MAG: MarR family winged helix-turn-helix transcriptional regulator [Eubacteriales bacterium]
MFIIGIEIAKIHNQIMRELEYEITTHVDKNMSATTARIICFVIEENKKRTVIGRDIEDFLNLKRSSVSLILSTMEKNQFITRNTVPYNAKIKHILPTSKAFSYYEQIIKCFNRVELKMKNNIQNIDQLQDLLDAITENLNTKEENPWKIIK